jgi:hypothetical protein
MKWYSARIVTQCFVDGKPSRGSQYLFDESVIVVRANNPEHAHKRAQQYGRLSQTKYKNDQGETVVWKFCGLSDLDEILEKSITSGTEVSSVRKVFRSKHELVVKKNQLTVFWAERNKHKTAAEILDE